ncbi:MAG: hypothetical protein ACOY3P_24395 [Planctomycetota bacterium]
MSYRNSLWIAAILAAGVMWGAAPLRAAEKETKAGSPEAKATTKVDDVAALQAKIHRRMAALIEAQAADEPDRGRAQQLTKELDQLRSRLRDAAAAASTDTQTPAAAWRCPFGGPGPMGPAAGMRGGRGRGVGAGYGAGLGPRGGQGYGRGPGMGRGAGRAAGAGWGRAFIDLDGNGLCDRYEGHW